VSRLLVAGLLVWAVLVAGGLGALAHYAATPGQPALAPAQWPVATGLVRAAGRPTMLVFLHPRCTCSQATLEELARLMARAPGAADVTVLLMAPTGVDPAWTRTALWQKATRLGVNVRLDAGRAEANRFGVATSGEVLLYDVAGSLRFSGGITPARGHEGDSDGGDALASLLRGEAPKLAAAPVFGCPLCRAEERQH
jgi:hypothetical protein